MTQHETTRITRVEQKVDDLIESVKEIRDALIGNSFTNGEGLVQRFDKMEKRVVILERMFWRGVWMGTGICVFCGVLYSVIQLFK